MSAPRPRIGLSSCLMHADPERPLFKGKALHYTEEKMAFAVWRAGALPVGLLDLKSAQSCGEQISQVDALLLQGGADVAPETYGEKAIDPRWCGDRERDIHEARLIEAALAANKPIIGLCRGIQVLNAALGGSLYQDIGTQREGALTHRDWHQYEGLEHDVRLDPKSWLAGVYGRSELLVNTVHHQAIKELADGLCATAWAPDGIIEAVEWIDDERWICGIQWHPEWLDGSPEGGNHRAEGRKTFEAFVDVVRQRVVREHQA